MRQFTYDEFVKIVKLNGFQYNRCKGSHTIFTNSEGNHISIPQNLECVIALRLIKEYNLETDLKKLKNVKKKISRAET